MCSDTARPCHRIRGHQQGNMQHASEPAKPHGRRKATTSQASQRRAFVVVAAGGVRHLQVPYPHDPLAAPHVAH